MRRVTKDRVQVIAKTGKLIAQYPFGAETRSGLVECGEAQRLARDLMDAEAELTMLRGVAR